MPTVGHVLPSKAVLLALCISLALFLNPPARAQSAAQPAASAPSDIEITASPAVVQASNGKLPSTQLLAVTAKSCNSVDLSNYTLQIAAPGLSIAKTPALAAGKCTIMGTINIDPSTPAGNYKVILSDSNGKPSGNVDFAVLEATAGPIPGGIAPQVDVIWEVLSQRVCNDVFGKRVARNFYCIEVKIGNNTGHPLQLAGVGFSPHIDKLTGTPDVILANTSYVSTRAVLLRESVLSPRNEFYHLVQASGLLMAGGIPYFHAANATAHYATAVSIVSGPLLQAINIIGPDRVVGQLGNLDDQSFRDNQIVPNNTQVRTVVFLEKQAVTELLNGLSPSIKSITSLEQQSSAAGNTDQNGSNARGPNTKRLMAAKLNSEQKDTHFWGLFRSQGFSPLFVKLALGNLVVVGQEIEYLQRIQVQGVSSTSSSAMTLNPSHLDFGNQNVGTPTAAQSVTVANTSTSAFSGLVINVSGTNQGDFTETNTCGTSLAGGATCTISVFFTPTAQSSRGATLNVSYAGATPQTVSLSGNGTQGATGFTVNPATLPAFAVQSINSASSPKVVTVTNTGAGPITGVSIALGGGNPEDFSESTTCAASISAGSNCTISVTFKPLVSGPRGTTLTITYTSAGAQLAYPLNLSGTGQ